MIELENLDIRAVNMGINLSDCSDSDMSRTTDRVFNKVVDCARDLVPVVEQVSDEYGIPIINKRVAVTPISYVGAATGAKSYFPIADALDRAARRIGIDYVGGYSALVHKAIQENDRILINSIPEAISRTETVCASVSVASSKAGINMDAVLLMARVIKETAEETGDRGGIGCARLMVFANVPEDNPFIAGSLHGFGEGECAINVAISGPGVIKGVLTRMKDADLGEVSEAIKKTAFKITRMGELVGREVSRRLGVSFGIVDLSLAPTPAQGDSVAEILEEIGLQRCGAHGSTAALALLTDAVKKGGAMASSSVGGLSGAFIPVSEDMTMVKAAEEGALNIDKLEAMSSVCSVGLDMIVIPGDTTVETIAAIIADEMAIGVMNDKTTAVRIIPAPGKSAGEYVEYGGLLGRSVVMPVNKFSSELLVKRGGRIPAPGKYIGN
ncbi:MAG: PFL family protein [Candidatus Eremiobacteraeota bacterium]|nr:PFL family protein [Candidatus Eremiobacteraeota bacterium]